MEPKETPTEAIQEKLKSKAGIKQLIGLNAVDDMDENLDWERNAIKRQADADHKTIYGSTDSAGQEGSAMASATKFLVAGDMTINQAPKQEASESQSSLLPVIEKAPSVAASLGKVALVASLLGGGSGVGGTLLLNYLLGEQPMQEFTDTDTDTQYEFGLGKPPESMEP